jgi:hypothetical protein
MEFTAWSTGDPEMHGKSSCPGATFLQSPISGSYETTGFA